MLVVEHRSAPAPEPFRLRLVAGDTPHLVIQDSLTPDAALADVNPLQLRVVASLRAVARPQSAQALRDVLRVRKADLLTALRALERRHIVTKSTDGWAIADIGA